MKPEEYTERLAAYLTGPAPKDPNAPLSKDEQALVDAQGEQLARDQDR